MLKNTLRLLREGFRKDVGMNFFTERVLEHRTRRPRELVEALWALFW